MSDPASIRNNNPGAMWPGPSAARFGSTGGQSLADGNQIATFADPVDGAAAHFDLLSRSYAGMPLSAAISKWSGGNSSPAYAANVAKQAGISLDTPLTHELLAGPQGLALAKAQAQWEAGKPYPLSEDQWQQAQSRAFSGQTPSATATAAAAPGAPPAAGGSLPAPPGGAALGMLAGQMPMDPNAGQEQADPNLALLQQRAAQMMQEQPEAPPPLPPIAMPMPRGQLAARLRAAALGRGLTGGI